MITFNEAREFRMEFNWSKKLEIAKALLIKELLRLGIKDTRPYRHIRALREAAWFYHYKAAVPFRGDPRGTAVEDALWILYHK